MKKILLIILIMTFLVACSSPSEEKKTEFTENEIATTDDFEFDIKSVRRSYKDSMWLSDNHLYVVIEMTIKNVSNEKQTISTTDWKLQNNNLVETDVSSMNSLVGNQSYSIDLLAGGVIEAVLFFEQPLDNSGLVLVYYSNMFSDEPEIKINLSTNTSDNPVKETPYAKSETVTYRDIMYTVEEVETSIGEGYKKPDTGNVFLGVTIKVKNVSTIDTTEIDSLGWKIIDESGVSHDSSFFTVWDTESFYDKQLNPGSDFTYLVAFEVPKNGKWRLAFYDNTFDNKEKFSIQLD
jgi:hypothetical protein